MVPSAQLPRRTLTMSRLSFALFIVATVAAKVRGLDITCGCFGHASKNWSFSAHLTLDLGLLAALLVLMRISAKRFV